MRERISTRLRALRARKCWRQRDVAERLGINLWTYAAYERFRLPPTERLVQLAALYAIPVSALVADVANDDMAEPPAPPPQEEE